MKYRADIDGLRSVAVLSIFLFHINPDWMPGGFVGVDIFFVISGFLIGGIVHGEMAEHKFSIARFYERRFRRIIPALFVMLTVTMIAGYFTIFPAIYSDFAKGALASAFSVSNIYFWNTTSYFGLDAHSKPLLHTWSLGVEEQFYIFFPLALYCLFRFFPKRIFPLVVLALLASFALSVVGAYRSPSGTFWLLPTRAWELLLGYLIVLVPMTALRNGLLRSATALGGAAALAITLIFYNSEMRFPGLSAALPCFGSAAIIASGKEGATPISRLLSIKPCVWIGLISYSLYLWHWPLIVFLREGIPLDYFTVPQGAGVLFAGILLGYLSWRFVEQPFRSRRFGRKAIFSATAAGAAAITISSLAIITNAGLPGRFEPRVAKMAGFITYSGHTEYPHGTCLLDGYDFAAADRDPCLSLDPDRPNVAILGDSHAEHLWYGLSQTMPSVHFVPVTVSGCRPRLHPLPQDLDRCTRPLSFILRKYLPSHSVDLVLLAANWDAQDPPRVASLIDWLQKHGRKVVLVGPMPAYYTQLAKLLALSYLKHDPPLPDRFFDVGRAPLDKRFAALAAEKGVPYVSAYRLICPDRCNRVDGDGVPLQYDTAHLTDQGSLYMAHRISPRLTSLLENK